MLWLIRHGESTGNAGAATADYATIPLTARGLAQAAAVAAACPERPARVLLSPYLRARQTAEPLLARHPGVPVAEAPVQEFTYLALPRGVALDAAAKQPLVDAYWARLDPHHREGPDVESFADLLARGRALLDRPADETGVGLVFCHEQFIRAVLLHVLYGPAVSPAELMRRFLALRVGLPIPNAAIVRLDRRAGRWWAAGVDVSHLPAE